MELGEVVPLETLLQAPSVGGRSRFAVTFDDDNLSHHDVVLPLLQELE